MKPDPKTQSSTWAALVLGCLLTCSGFSQASEAISPTVPGTVIDHIPAAGQFIGSPSLVILTNGDYLASQDIFGPNSSTTCPTTVIFHSADQGGSWREIARVQCAFWASLFVHHDTNFLTFHRWLNFRTLTGVNDGTVNPH